MAETVGSLLVRLGLDSGAFRSGMDVAEKEFRAVQKRFEQVGKAMQNMGQKLTLGLTLPLTALGAAAVKGAQDQAAAMGQVEAALASMGNVSGKTADQLAKAADAMEMRSLFDADMILTQVTAQLLTFGNVAGDVFDRAQQAAIDMATRMGSDPQSAAIMLGKALNDPVKGITALTRVGVQFTDAQKKQIEAFQKTGQTAKAQGIILSEVERQFKGAAQAAADTQPWRQAKVAIDQAMDGIGEAILPVIPVIADSIKSLAQAFADLSPGMQKALVIAGGLAAALGPVLTVAGGLVKIAAPLAAAFTTSAAASGAAGTAAAGASTGFAALAAAAAPWIAAGAAIAGAGYLIYSNWDKIAPVLSEVWETISATLGPPLQQIISTVTTMLTELWNGPLGSLALGAVSVLGEVGEALLKVFGPVILGAIKLALGAVGNALTALLEFGRAIGSLFSGDITGAFKHLASAIDALFGGLPSKVINWMAQLVTGVKAWLVNKLNAVWDWVIGKVKVVGDAFYNLWDRVVGHSYVPDMVDEIGVQMRRLEKEMVEPAKKATSKAAEAFRELQRTVADILSRLFPEQADAMAFERERAALDAYHRAGKLSADQHRAAVEALRREYLGLNRDIAGALTGEGETQIEMLGGGKTIEDMLEETGNRLPQLLGKTGKDLEAALTPLQEVGANALQTLEEALVSAAIQFDNLRELAHRAIQSILADLLKLAIRKFITGPIAAAIGVPISGALAEGGPAMAGRTYLVGEEGPELFTPSRSGQVIPNHALAAANGGGRNQNITVNLNNPVFTDPASARASQQQVARGVRVAVNGPVRV